MGAVGKAEWLTSSLESALKSSDALPLLSHLRTLTSRLFSENESLKKQNPCKAKGSIQQERRGRLPPLQSLGAEEAVRLARRLAQENSYLETFISSDARVLQSAALLKAQRERAAALESNRRLKQQAERDRQVIAELELKSRAFADAYAWLTSHNRMIHAKDAPALVALWRKRVAAAAVAKKGPLAPEFSKDLAEAYAAADSEGETETASEDGSEKKAKEDLLRAAELREADAVREARQAQANAALAEARAVAAERQLAAARTQLEGLKRAAAAYAGAAVAPPPPSPSPPKPPDGAGEKQLKAALRDSEARAEAAEKECTRMKAALEDLQAALDLAESGRQRLEQELAEAVASAEAKLTAQTEQHAAELAQMQAQHSQEMESMKGSVHDVVNIRRELEEARQKCADLSTQLAAAQEKGTGQSLTKAASPVGIASPPASDISTLTSERNNYKATAMRLEMDIKRLSARAAEATQLEKTVAALKEKLQAGEEIKAAYDALQSEVQTLRGQLSTSQSPPAASKGPVAHGEPTESITKEKERDALTEEIEALKKQLAILRGEAGPIKALEKGLNTPQVTGVEDSSSKEAIVSAAEVAELVEDRNILQKRVSELEEELKSLRAAAKSPAKASPEPKNVPCPTSTPQTSKPPPSKKPPAPTPKERGTPISSLISASAGTAVARGGDEVGYPSTAEVPCAAKVPPPTAPKALPAAAGPSANVSSSSSEANSAAKAALPKRSVPLAGGKVLATDPPKIVAKTLATAPSQGEQISKSAEPSSALLPKAPVASSAVLSEATSSPGELLRQPEAQVATKGKAEAKVTSSKKVPSPLPPKAAGPKVIPQAPDLKGTATLPETNVEGEPKSPISKKSQPSLGGKASGAGLASDTKTPSPDSSVSRGDEAVPSPSETAAASGIGAAKSAAASVNEAKSGGTALPKTLVKGTKVPPPPKKAPPVESPVVTEEVFSREAKEQLEKQVAELREQLAAREELRKEYETVLKENESLRAQLNAAEPLEKLSRRASVGEDFLDRPEVAVTAPHGDYAALAEERDGLADKVKALEQELAALRDSQKASLVNKAPLERKLMHGPKGLPLSKAGPEPTANSLATKSLAKGSAGIALTATEEAAAQAGAKLEDLEREVVTLRQQLEDGKKIKEDYAALLEETKKVRSENEALKKQGERPVASLVTGPQDSGSKETTLTAAQVAELEKERNTLQERVRELEGEVEALRASAPAAELEKERTTLQERVRELEEELAALRASAKSFAKAPPATKSFPSPLPGAQTSKPPPSKTPPATATKLGKTVAILSAADKLEKSPGDDSLQGASYDTAEPPASKAKPTPLPPKAVKAVADGSLIVVAPPAVPEAESTVKAGPPVSKKLPTPLAPKAAKAPPTAESPRQSTQATRGAHAEGRDSAAASLEDIKPSGTLPLKTAPPEGPSLASAVDGPASGAKVKAPSLASAVDGPASGAKVKADPAPTKKPEPLPGKKAPGAVLASDTRAPSPDSSVSRGDEAVPSPSETAAASGIGAAKSAAASVNEAKSGGTALPKTLVKGTKVPPPPKKAPPVESPVVTEEVFSREAKEQLEKQVAELREQLAAREELRKEYETLQRENESLRAQLNAAEPVKKPSGLPSTGGDSSDKSKMAMTEAKQLKATAELEAELTVLRPKAAAVELLEKDIKRLQEQLSASAELRMAHEALKKETEALKEQLNELQSKAGHPVELSGAKAGGKGQIPVAGELEAVLRERDELRERVRVLEKELTAVVGSTTQPSTMHITAKESPAQSGPAQALSTKKPPPPLLKQGQATVLQKQAKSPAAALPGGEKGDKASPEDTGEEVIRKAADVTPPTTAKPASAQEKGTTEATICGKGLPSKTVEPSVGKMASFSKAGTEPPTIKQGDEMGRSAEGSPKTAKKPPPPSPKPAVKGTKVPPPPKKAPPVEAPLDDGIGLTGEAKGNLEKEIESLREQLTAAGDLKRTHEALQKEFEALQGELKALKAQTKANGAEEGAERDEAAILDPHETELLRRERNTLRERVAALEAELSTFRAVQVQGVTIPKTKGSLPSKAKPGKSPLPGKVPKHASGTAKEAHTSEAAAERKDESPLTSGDTEAAKQDTHDEAKSGLSPRKGATGEVPPNKASLLTQEILSKSDAETEVGDSDTEPSPAEERVAKLTERLQRAKRRVRNLVIKCNALVEMERDRDALRSRLESLQAKHEAISNLRDKTGKDDPGMAGGDKAKGTDTLLKSASAAALSASGVASTVADELEGVSTMDTGLTTQSSSALLDVRPPADWVAKYEKLKAQRDKVYQAYKAQKERISSLEEEEAITKEKLEKLERLYQETKEELDVVTRPPKQREGAESTGILSWLGGGAHDEKTPEEQKLRARLELMQQRLQKALSENQALNNELAQMRTSSAESLRGDRAAEGEATRGESQGRAPQHLSPDAAMEGAAHAPLTAKAPSATPSGSLHGEDSETQRKSLADLQEQIKQKDAQIEEYKAKILELKATVVPVPGATSAAAELTQKEQELQAKSAELAKLKEEALEKDSLIKEKMEEVTTLKARLEALEKEKLQALNENSALKKELETVQRELEALKDGRSVPTAAKEKPKPPSSGDVTSSPMKAVKRSSSIAKRTPGLPPPAPASKADRPDTAATDASETKKEEQQAASSKGTQKKVTGRIDDELAKPEESSKGRDEKSEEPHSEASGTETVSKKNSKKTTAETDDESKPRKSPKDDSEGGKKKKKKKKKGEASNEMSTQQSEVGSIANQEDAGDTTAAADATSSWGFGFFGNSEGASDTSKNDADAKDASASALRPSLLGLIVGETPAEETAKGNERPPLKLSTVDGADDQSDGSSSEDGETDGGIASTIAGFFWGV
ncbi:hypothetical protein, conserved [Eimeria brunetti]|uniref:Uncharacterized protein n=1 Tax=Eimeria brunetti TaxID=51314 RepID=U6LK71_9EIME|nr:hypothetical protein, conserved [Eimeria brunetti]